MAGRTIKKQKTKKLAVAEPKASKQRFHLAAAIRQKALANRKAIALVASTCLVAALVVLLKGSPIGLVNLAPAAESTAAAQPPANLFPNPDRDSYGIGVFIDANRNPIRKPIKEAFVDLPLMPDDFAEKINSMRSENFNSIALELSEAYYKQPEFLPKFGELGLHYWQAPDLKRWGREGFGVYPAEQQYSLKAGGKVQIAAFVHAAYGIETFQGMQLYPFFPQDENAALFFSITIEPKSILLGPTYPTVDGNWIQKVKIKINASNETPKGNYLVGFNATLPGAEQNAAWQEKHGYKYIAGQGMFSIGTPRLGIWVKVE